MNVIELQIDEISKLEKKCRDTLLYDSVSRETRKRNGAFDQLCALLDFIGDSDSALWSITSSDKRASIENYFLAYGLLQLMYTRQISLIKVLRTFGLAISPSLKSNAICAARDCVIGHPITSNGNAHVIVRNSLSENGFEYWSYNGPETRRGNMVEYDTLLSEHLTVMASGLVTLSSHLAEIENNRRRTMRQKPVSRGFRGIDYVVRCIASGVVEEKYGPIVGTNCKIVLKALEAFRSALVERFGEEWASFKVDHVVEGLAMLQSIFPPPDKRGACQYQIIAEGIEPNVLALMRLAAEIDENELKEI